jgi:hypothetical protein
MPTKGALAFAYQSIPSPSWLARLVYEHLDAERDTERLVRKCRSELPWRARLSYLRDLRRRNGHL